MNWADVMVQREELSERLEPRLGRGLGRQRASDIIHALVCCEHEQPQKPNRGRTNSHDHPPATGRSLLSVPPDLLQTYYESPDRAAFDWAPGTTPAGLP